jgi:hypothetical protein
LGGNQWSNMGNMYNLALEKLSSSSKFVSFLSSESMVSEGWLLPLLDTVTEKPLSIVYPAIDIIDPVDDKLTQGSNVVAGFDWALGLRWEDATSYSNSGNNRRLFPEFMGTADDTTLSPALPLYAFLTTINLINELGGFHGVLKDMEKSVVELSLRSWMCGGSLIRQPCSRFAVKFDNLWEDSLVPGVGPLLTTLSASDGSSSGAVLSQGDVDMDTTAVAEAWLSAEMREIVFQARFADRLPYKVDVPWDNRAFMGTLRHMLHQPEVTNCATFSWYINNIYPALGTEIDSITAYFQSKQANQESVTREKMAPILATYGKVPGHSLHSQGHLLGVGTGSLIGGGGGGIVSHNSGVDTGILSEASRNEFPPVVVPPPQPPPPPPPKKTVDTNANDKVKSPRDVHVDNAKDNLICKDFKGENEIESSCKSLAMAGDCTANAGFMIFGCSQSCGLCDTEGKLCTDYYLKMCPTWASSGRCDLAADVEWMRTNCRHSCGYCAHPGDPPAKRKDGILPAAPDAKTYRYKANPYKLQEDYKAGKISDFSDDACMINGKPHGNLLSKVTVHSNEDIVGQGGVDTTEDESYEEGGPPRIFCAIYTYDKNHKTNVEATRKGWAKRCTGFVAFSTVDDESIPAFKIEHEGKEEYDNMWQKSREIWKYIAANYADDFDYFLIGGDDMFYIIENLGYYLSSPEIREEFETKNGMHIGRRFFPPNQIVFNSGGAGYILDKHSLKKIAPLLDSPKCYAHQVGFWEDVNVAHCLQVLDIKPYDTRDSQGRERFHPFSPGQHLEYRIPTKPDWYAKYNPELKVGYECCSADSISFHYVKSDIMGRLHNYVYGCNNKH